MSGRAVETSESSVAARAHPALTWFVLYCAASGAVEGLSADRPESEMLFLAVQIAVSGFLVFWWASDDAKRRGLPLSRLAPVWIVLFGVFWVLWRLFTSRHRLEAWRGFGRGVLVMLASLGAYLLFFELFVPVMGRG